MERHRGRPGCCRHRYIQACRVFTFPKTKCLRSGFQQWQRLRNEHNVVKWRRNRQKCFYMKYTKLNRLWLWSFQRKLFFSEEMFWSCIQSNLPGTCASQLLNLIGWNYYFFFHNMRPRPSMEINCSPAEARLKFTVKRRYLGWLLPQDDLYRVYCDWLFLLT